MREFMTRHRDVLEMLWVTLVLMAGVIVILATGLLMIGVMSGPPMPTRAEIGATLYDVAHGRAVALAGDER